MTDVERGARVAGSSRADAVRRAAVAYLVIQGTLAVVWWGFVLTNATVRAWFETVPERPNAFGAFLLADAVVFVGGSFGSALALGRRSRWAVFATAFTAGGIAYATLYLVNWVVLEGSAAAGVVPMVAALVMTTTVAVVTRSTHERD